MEYETKVFDEDIRADEVISWMQEQSEIKNGQKLSLTFSRLSEELGAAILFKLDLLSETLCTLTLRMCDIGSTFLSIQI